MHWYVDFKDPVADPDREPTIVRVGGGLPGADADDADLLREVRAAGPAARAAVREHVAPTIPQRVAKWLGEVFGGPTLYSEQYGGYPRMISQHIGKGLTEEKRARWVALILRSAQEAGLPDRSRVPLRVQLVHRMGFADSALENSQPGAKPPEHMPMPHWDWNTAAGPPGSRISALEPPAERGRAAPCCPRADEPVELREARQDAVPRP